MLTHPSARRTELWLIGKFTRSPRKPRTHCDAADGEFAQVAAGIVEFGINNPAWWTPARGTRCRILCSNTSSRSVSVRTFGWPRKICKVPVSLVTQQRLPANRAVGEIA